MKKLLLIVSLILLISDFGHAATRKIYINFDNKPSIDPSTGLMTGINTAPSQGIISAWRWEGTWLPATLGTYSQYITGRGGTGYALSGIINNESAPGVGTWPYIEWFVNDDVPSMPEIYVSFWMKYINYKVDKTFKPYQNIKLFYWKFQSGSGSELMGEIAVGNAPNGNPPPFNEYTLDWRGKIPFEINRSGGYPAVNDADGNWHHYEFHLNRTTGRARWWVDGNLIHDWNSGDPANLGGPYYIAWMHIAGSLIGTGPNSYGTRAFDDIEVWDGMPGTPQPTTSPNAPKPPMNIKIQ